MFMDLPVTPLAVADVTGTSAYLIHERVYKFSPTRCSVDFDAQHRSGRVFLAPEDRGHARSCKRSSENSSLPLCVSFRHISWMTTKWGRGWLENSLPLEMAVEESPLGP